MHNGCHGRGRGFRCLKMGQEIVMSVVSDFSENIRSF